MKLIIKPFLYFLIASLTFLIAGCQSVAVKEVVVKDVVTAPVSKKSKPVSLSKIIVKLNRGEMWGKIQEGLLCVPGFYDLKWRQGRVNITSEIFDDIFRETFEQNGYEVSGNPDNLFENKGDIQTDYALGGLIKDMKANICFPYSGFGNWETVKGEAYLEVEWQIYNILDREVVKTIKTEGSYKKENTEKGYLSEMIIEEAFAVAVNNLLANKEITDMLLNDRKSKPLNNPYADASYIEFAKEKNNSFKENITEIRAAVATVRSSVGHGSGFFISNSGYMLTNQHVVGDAEYVKVILPTGREIIGDVIKTDKSRDIALLKTESAGLSILPIENLEPLVGEDIYAIGSPLDEELSSTVSSGIISGYREFNQQTYIQSDVNIVPGNSGGPLINEQGNVVGVAVSGIQISGVSTGLNFFIPIGAALKSLNLKEKLDI